MARAPKATIRHREQQALALHLAGESITGDLMTKSWWALLQTQMRHFCTVSTFNELIVEAQQAIRARIDSEADELTGYFVAQGAVLLACLRCWAQITGRTDAEIQAAIESGNKGTLEKAVRDLAESDDPDALMASRLLQVIAGRPQPHLFETSHCASTAFQ